VLDGSLPFTILGKPFGPDYKDVPGLPEETLLQIQELEKLMHENDLAVTAKNDAKNKLEQFVFDIRRYKNNLEFDCRLFSAKEQRTNVKVYFFLSFSGKRAITLWELTKKAFWTI
jgi:hypothetical protein